MSAYHHRTAGGISDELSPDQRLAISQRSLAREVSTACDAWLRARGIAPGKLFYYDGPVQRAGDPIAGQEKNLTTTTTTK